MGEVEVGIWQMRPEWIAEILKFEWGGVLRQFQLDLDDQLTL